MQLLHRKDNSRSFAKGPLLIGGWLMSVLYGVACTQVRFCAMRANSRPDLQKMHDYFSEYPRDPHWLIGLVTLLWYAYN